MDMERLLPTGKQLFVCDHFFQGDIAWGGIFMDASKLQKKKKKKGGERKKKTATTTTKTNKQTNKHKISMTVPEVISMG